MSPSITHPSFPFSHYIVEQFLPGVFHDHDDIRRGRDDFVSTISYRSMLDIQFDDMRMSEDFEVLDLPLHSGIHIRRGYLGAVYELQSDLMARDRVRRDWSLAFVAFMY